MKIRALLFTLICALVTSTGVLAADAETELGGKMEKMGGAFRALRRQITDASRNADSIAKVATIRQNAEASMKLDPAMKKDIPAAKQAKFVADEVLEELPLDLRAVFILFELEEMTVVEIAAMIGIPTGTAASRLRRGRELFQQTVARVRGQAPRRQP